MISLQDLIERFGKTEIAERTDREHYTTIDETVVNLAIADAVAEVVAYLNPTGLIANGVYVGIPPKGLVIKVCDIARYYLYDDGVTDIVEKRYQQAIDWLKIVAKNPNMLTGEKDLNANLGVNSGIVVIPNEVPDFWKMG